MKRTFISVLLLCIMMTTLISPMFVYADTMASRCSEVKKIDDEDKLVVSFLEEVPAKEISRLRPKLIQLANETLLCDGNEVTDVIFYPGTTSIPPLLRFFFADNSSLRVTASDFLIEGEVDEGLYQASDKFSDARFKDFEKVKVEDIENPKESEIDKTISDLKEFLIAEIEEEDFNVTSVHYSGDDKSFIVKFDDGSAYAIKNSVILNENVVREADEVKIGAPNEGAKVPVNDLESLSSMEEQRITNLVKTAYEPFTDKEIEVELKKDNIQGPHIIVKFSDGSYQQWGLGSWARETTGSDDSNIDDNDDYNKDYPDEDPETRPTPPTGNNEDDRRPDPEDNTRPDPESEERDPWQTTSNSGERPWDGDWDDWENSRDGYPDDSGDTDYPEDYDYPRDEDGRPDRPNDETPVDEMPESKAEELEITLGKMNLEEAIAGAIAVDYAYYLLDTNNPRDEDIELAIRSINNFLEPEELPYPTFKGYIPQYVSEMIGDRSREGLLIEAMSVWSDPKAGQGEVDEMIERLEDRMNLGIRNRVDEELMSLVRDLYDYAQETGDTELYMDVYQQILMSGLAVEEDIEMAKREIKKVLKSQEKDPLRHEIMELYLQLQNEDLSDEDRAALTKIYNKKVREYKGEPEPTRKEKKRTAPKETKEMVVEEDVGDNETKHPLSIFKIVAIVIGILAVVGVGLILVRR